MQSVATRGSKLAILDFVTYSWQRGTILPSLSKMNLVFDVTKVFIYHISTVKYVGQGEFPQNSPALSSMQKLRESVNYYEYF